MTGSTAPQPADTDVWAAIGHLQVQAWFCPVRSHTGVEWRGDVAHCTHDSCELTSEDTRPWLRDMAEQIAGAEAARDEANARAGALAVEVDRLRADLAGARAAIPDDIDPRNVKAMLRLLGPARMVLDRCAEEDSPQARAEAADMAQRLVDWIGHPVTDEPPWALLPCESPHVLTADGRGPDDPVGTIACRSCRPCMARVVAGYEAGLVDGVPVVEGTA